MSDDESIPVRIWVHDFDEEDVRRTQRQLDRLIARGQDYAPVYIHTNGGSTWGLAAMLDILASSPVPVATVAVGKCFSAGADLLASGCKGLRFVAPNATIMFHGAIESFAGRKLHEVEAEMANSRREEEALYALFDRHTGKRPGHWQRAVAERGNADWWMSAAEAVRLGLADHVGVPRIGFAGSDRKVTFEFEEPKRKGAKR